MGGPSYVSLADAALLDRACRRSGHSARRRFLRPSRKPRYRQISHWPRLRPTNPPSSKPAHVPSSVVPELLQAVREAPTEQKLQRLQDYLRGQIAHALGADAAKIDPEYPSAARDRFADGDRDREPGGSGIAGGSPARAVAPGRTIAGLADGLLPQIESLQAAATQDENGPDAFAAQELTSQEAAQLLEQLDTLSDERVGQLS